MTQCVKVPLKDAEKVKRGLLDSNTLDDGYFPLKEDGFLYFPVTAEGNCEKELNIRKKTN